MAVPRKPHGIGDRYVGSDYAADEVEFLRAMERFKRSRPFPTWTEVLKVLKGLGYRKGAEAPGGGRHCGRCYVSTAGREAECSESVARKIIVG